MLVCLNGQFIKRDKAQIALDDGSFLFGDSLFETIKARKKQILHLDQHLERIEQAAQLLEFPCPRAQIKAACTALSQRLMTPASRIRLTLSRGPYHGLVRPAPQQGWFLLTAAPYTEMDRHHREQGVKCCLAPNQRVNPFSHLPQCKHGNYADCLYARTHARRYQADEALFIDGSGNLLEGAASNLFVISDNQLVTPPLGTLVLNGITRQRVLAVAQESGLRCTERPLPLTEALNADEVFICNSLIDVVPVNNIDGSRIKRGEGWREIYKHISVHLDP